MSPNAPAYTVPPILPAEAKNIRIDAFLAPDISVIIDTRLHRCERRELGHFSPGERVLLFMPGHDLLTLVVAEIL